MGLEIRVSYAGRFMSAKVSGRGGLRDFYEMIDTLSQEATRMAATRLLVDLRAVEEDLKFTDHFSIGERTAISMGHLEKVASLVPEARRTGTSEKVANRKGVQLRVFVSEAEAAEWLQS